MQARRAGRGKSREQGALSMLCGCWLSFICTWQLLVQHSLLEGPDLKFCSVQMACNLYAVKSLTRFCPLQALVSEGSSGAQTALPLLRTIGHALARGGPSTLDPIITAQPNGAGEASSFNLMPLKLGIWGVQLLHGCVPQQHFFHRPALQVRRVCTCLCLSLPGAHCHRR